MNILSVLGLLGQFDSTIAFSTIVAVLSAFGVRLVHSTRVPLHALLLESYLTRKAYGRQ